VAKVQQRTGRVGHDALAEFVAFLTRGPRLDAVCDELVVSWRGPDTIDRAGIGLIAHDGSLVMSGCLASRAEAGAQPVAVSIWDETPAAVAVRDREVLVLGDRGEVERRFPNFADGMPDVAAVLAVPLVWASMPHGVCVVSSRELLRDREASVATMTELCLALSLCVHPMTLGRGEPRARSSERVGRAPGSRRFVPAELSVRQLAVLQGLLEGLSNRQIGIHIGYSESTVRHETMRIYAHFGASGRHEAVAVARMRGIVAPVGRYAERDETTSDSELL
jgi:DNA-binding CsgD family transcriptional regulator